MTRCVITAFLIPCPATLILVYMVDYSYEDRRYYYPGKWRAA